MKLPSSFVPQAVEDFIGPASVAVQNAMNIIQLAKGGGDTPVKLLFLGEPGIGKSAIARFLCDQVGSKFSTKKFNGTQVGIDAVNELSRALQFRDLFGDWQCIWVDEADKISKQAQVRWLSLADDLPPKTMVIFTSNGNIDQFEQRFQSRFVPFQLTGPTEAEIEAFLTQRLPNAAPAHVKQIAVFASGNVRQALLDADNLVAASMMKAA